MVAVEGYVRVWSLVVTFETRKQCFVGRAVAVVVSFVVGVRNRDTQYCSIDAAAVVHTRGVRAHVHGAGESFPNIVGSNHHGSFGRQRRADLSRWVVGLNRRGSFGRWRYANLSGW